MTNFEGEDEYFSVTSPISCLLCGDISDWAGFWRLVESCHRLLVLGDSPTKSMIRFIRLAASLCAQVKKPARADRMLHKRFMHYQSLLNNDFRFDPCPFDLKNSVTSISWLWTDFLTSHFYRYYGFMLFDFIDRNPSNPFTLTDDLHYFECYAVHNGTFK